MNPRDNRLYCFSPLVMLATFAIESCAALFILLRYRTDQKARLIIGTLSLLAIFQLAEYMICEKAFFISSLDWARLGYVAITLLPPVGIHLGIKIAQRNKPQLLMTAYASAAIFMVFFLFVGHGLQGEQCLGNYIIFSVAPYAVLPYMFYYYAWLFTGILLAWKARLQIKDEKAKQALFWLVIGYLTFLLPTLFVNILDHRTIAGIPSIMCGFAVLMALCLLLKVAPSALEENNQKQLLPRM